MTTNEKCGKCVIEMLKCGGVILLGALGAALLVGVVMGIWYLSRNFFGDDWAIVVTGCAVCGMWTGAFYYFTEMR